MTIVSILIFLIILTIIVTIHEAGHFMTAKKFGVYCKEFAIGMGPKIWSKQKDETTYAIRAIPMGGFVQMIGEDGELFSINEGDAVWLAFDEKNRVTKISYIEPDFEATLVTVVAFEKAKQPMKITYIENNETHTTETAALVYCYDDKNEEQYLVANNRQFNYLPPLKKIVVLTAGVFLNFVLGFVVVFGATWINGVNVSPIIATDTSEVSVGEHFEVGDEIIAIDNQSFTNLSELTAYIQANPNKTIAVKVNRNNKEITLERKTLDLEGQTLSANGIETYRYGALGITYQRSHTNLIVILKQTFASFFGFFEYVYFVLIGLFTGKIKITNLTGFVGIAQQTNAVITATTSSTTLLSKVGEISARLLNFMAFLSVNIGVMNILPFPALDGGRVVFAVYELIFKRKPNPKFETYLNAFGFILLIAIFIGVTFLDIKRLFS